MTHVLEKLNFINQAEPVDYEHIQRRIAEGKFFVCYNRNVFYKGRRLGNVFRTAEWSEEDLELYEEKCAGSFEL